MKRLAVNTEICRSECGAPLLARNCWLCSSTAGTNIPYSISNSVIQTVTQGENTLHVISRSRFWTVGAQLQNSWPTVSRWRQLIYRARHMTSAQSGFAARRGFIFGKSVLWVRNWFHYSPSIWPALSSVPSPKHSAAERPWSTIQGDPLLEAIRLNKHSNVSSADVFDRWVLKGFLWI